MEHCDIGLKSGLCNASPCMSIGEAAFGQDLYHLLIKVIATCQLHSVFLAK